MVSQRGVIILGVVIVIAISAGLFLLTEVARARLQVAERESESQKRLQSAKDALLHYAVAHDRRGHFPCPADHTLAGLATEGQAASACTSDVRRLGVLPWRTLDAQGLFDVGGERLWYAVSEHMLNSAAFINPDQPLPNLLSLDGRSDYVALVFSAGLSGSAQDRANIVAACAATADSRNNRYCPSNYLDAVAGADNTNADRTFFSKREGINDLVLGITAAEFFNAVGKRVMQQVAGCLRQYAIDPGHTPGTVGRLPWATPFTGTDSPSFTPPPAQIYTDVASVRVGRLPLDFSGTTPPGPSQALTGVSGWGANCPLHCTSRPNCDNSWMKDWREHVVYAVSERHAPDGDAGTAMPFKPFLTLTLADGTVRTDVAAVIMLSGVAVGGQTRATNASQQDRMNYLEGTNATSSAAFDARTPAGQNDHVLQVIIP
jgi:hypothetical protein